MTTVKLTRSQLQSAVGNDAQTLRVFERVISGDVQIRTTNVSANVDFSDDVVVLTGGGGATLPKAKDGVGSVFIIKRAGGAVTVSAATGETIDGAPTFVLSAAQQAVTVVSDGKGWVTI